MTLNSGYKTTDAVVTTVTTPNLLALKISRFWYESTYEVSAVLDPEEPRPTFKEWLVEDYKNWADKTDDELKDYLAWMKRQGYLKCTTSVNPTRRKKAKVITLPLRS